MSKIQVLITGATGFIGQTFLKAYSDVYELKTLNLRQVAPNQADFTRTDTILHLAALVHQMNGAPEDHYFQINTLLTEQLAIEAKAQGVKHFVFMSSAHVYGQYGNIDNPDELLSENTMCKPLDAYGQSKLVAEKKLSLLQDENFKVSIIRSPLVYGPGGKGNLNSLKELIQFLPILPFRYTTNKRSLIFINNLCHFIHLIIDKQISGIYLPQDERPISIEQLVQFVAKALGKKIILFKLPVFLFKIMIRLKPSIMQRLYGSLALDSTVSNEKIIYQPLFTTQEALAITFENSRSPK